MWEKMVDVVKPCKKGEAFIKHREVSEYWVEVAKRQGDLPLEAGPIAQLYVDGQLMMSDGLHEKQTNEEFVRQARGDVLVVGLGIGMVLVPILRKPDVRTVTVLEKSRDVIDLVWPQLEKYVGPESSKLGIVLGDVFEYPAPEEQFDVIYFDIWPTLSDTNYVEMKALKNLYRPSLREGGWMAAWCEETCRDFVLRVVERMGLAVKPTPEQRAVLWARAARDARPLRQPPKPENGTATNQSSSTGSSERYDHVDAS